MLQDIRIHGTTAQEVLVLCKCLDLEWVDIRVARKLNPGLRPFARQIYAVGATASWRDHVRHLNIAGKLDDFAKSLWMLAQVSHTFLHVNHDASAIRSRRPVGALAIKGHVLHPFHQVEKHLSSLDELLVTDVMGGSMLFSRHEFAREDGEICNFLFSREWPNALELGSAGPNVNRVALHAPKVDLVVRCRTAVKINLQASENERVVHLALEEIHIDIQSWLVQHPEHIVAAGWGWTIVALKLVPHSLSPEFLEQVQKEFDVSRQSLVLLTVVSPGRRYKLIMIFQELLPVMIQRRVRLVNTDGVSSR
jgi:hypothetical protein